MPEPLFGSVAALGALPVAGLLWTVDLDVFRDGSLESS